MKRTLLAMAVLALSVGSAQAQDYQMELGGTYSDLSSDTPGGDDSGFAIDFTYHLNGVKTAGHPLAEAAFLTRSNNIGAAYFSTDESDTDAFAVQGEFYVNQLYLRGAYAAATDSSGTTDIDADIFEARIGLMLGAGLRLAAGMNRTDVDVPGTDAANDVVLEAKYVSAMGGGTAMNLAGDLTFYDDGGTGVDTTGLNLQGDYYFSPAGSVGVLYAKIDSDAAAADSDDFGVRGRYFFTPMFSGELAYTTASDGDDDVITARAALRF